MNKLITLIFLIGTISSFSQTVQLSVNDSVFDGKDTAYVDINGDSIDDISINRYWGIDALFYNADALQSNVKLNSPVQYGVLMLPYGQSVPVNGSMLSCVWGTTWPLNTGLRYLGYSHENSPGDTTFGYLTLDFRGDWMAGCLDTMFILFNTYSVVSNIHLTGGQLITNVETPSGETLDLRFNHFDSRVEFNNNNGSEFNIDIYDSSGRRIISTRTRLEYVDVSRLTTGFYFISIKKQGGLILTRSFSKF